MEKQIKFLKIMLFVIISIWSVVITIFVITTIKDTYKFADELALNEAMVSAKKDLAYRRWGASHGGVYVPITKKTPPNPYLSHIRDRDVNTTSGLHLTLMNPAYMLRQMMDDYSNLYGIKGHITSKKLLNPKNKPDIWEEKALDIIEKTRKPYYEKTIINHKVYMRYFNPLVAQKSCLKCHGIQGYKVGDIRGAVSISVPIEKYYNEAMSNTKEIILEFFIIWFVGLGIIIFGYKKLKIYLKEKIKNYEQNIFSLVDLIEQRDSYTAGHTKRVAKYAVKIAKEMNLDKEQVEKLYIASMLHDIGKISTPDSILLKPGKLTELEYKLIQQHVIVGYEILKNIDIFKDIALIVKFHHERYDGTGYPDGLKKDEIPLLSHIMAVADSFDAMTTDRIYKGRKDVKTTLEELEQLSGKSYHPDVIKAAIKALKNITVDNSATQLPQTDVEKARFAYFYKDNLTELYNKDYLHFILSNNKREEFHYKHIYAIYLHHFTKYNQEYGWSSGDKLLNKIGNILNESGVDSLAFRVYGDDFIILSKNVFDIEKTMNKINELLKDLYIEISYKYIYDEKLNIKNIHDLDKSL